MTILMRRLYPVTPEMRRFASRAGACEAGTQKRADRSPGLRATGGTPSTIRGHAGIPRGAVRKVSAVELLMADGECDRDEGEYERGLDSAMFDARTKTMR